MTADLATTPAPVRGHYPVVENGTKTYFTSVPPPGDSAPGNGCDVEPARVVATEHVTRQTETGRRYFEGMSADVPASASRNDVVSRIGLVPMTSRDVRLPVVLAVTDADQARAAMFTATLWDCIERAKGPRPDHRVHRSFPGAFTPEWLSGLDLPTREHCPDGQAVSLAGDGFTSHGDRAELLVDYETAPRTWVFERVDESIGWLNRAASYLTTLSASPFVVSAAVYDSRASDRPSAAHWDQWYSAVVQVEGAKVWRIGADWCRVTTRPGDVLLMPEGLVHAVSTPADPGLSRHLVFDIGVHTVYAHAA